MRHDEFVSQITMALSSLLPVIVILFIILGAFSAIILNAALRRPKLPILPPPLPRHWNETGEPDQ